MRKQCAFASLSSEELAQIAGWLRHQTYQAVLDRVRQPRPDGFGLDISVRPLQTLYAKIQKLDLINERLKGKDQLTLDDFDALSLGEKDELPLNVQDAILQTASDLATSGDNSPAELLALQRLADFPARAELRAQRMELELQKQLHKVEMDRLKEAHRANIDQHKKKMAEERIELQKRSLALREGSARVSRAGSGVPPESNPLAPEGERDGVRGVPPEFCDHLGPCAMNLDDIEARAAKKFGFQLRRRRGDETLETSSHPCSSEQSAVNLTAGHANCPQPSALKTETLV